MEETYRRWTVSVLKLRYGEAGEDWASWTKTEVSGDSSSWCCRRRKSQKEEEISEKRGEGTGKWDESRVEVGGWGGGPKDEFELLRFLRQFLESVIISTKRASTKCGWPRDNWSADRELEAGRGGWRGEGFPTHSAWRVVLASSWRRPSFWSFFSHPKKGWKERSAGGFVEWRVKHTHTTLHCLASKSTLFSSLLRKWIGSYCLFDFSVKSFRIRTENTSYPVFLFHLFLVVRVNGDLCPVIDDGD